VRWAIPGLTEVYKRKGEAAAQRAYKRHDSGGGDRSWRSYERRGENADPDALLTRDSRRTGSVPPVRADNCHDLDDRAGLDRCQSSRAHTRGEKRHGDRDFRQL
jgi:hypothetical protein